MNLIKQSVFYILLTLSCLNFLGKGPLIFFIFCVFTIIFCKQRIRVKSIKFVNSYYAYVLFSVFSVISSIFYLDTDDSVKAIIPCLVFYIALTYPDKITIERDIKRISMAIFIGLSFIYLSTYYLNYFVLGISQGIRKVTNIWTMEDSMPATIFSLYSSTLIGVSFYLIFILKNNFFRVLGVFIVIFIMYASFQSASRTPLLIFTITYLILAILYFKSFVHNKNIVFRFFITILGFIIIYFVFATVSDFSFISNSALSERLSSEGLSSSRSSISSKYYDLMLVYPLGGCFAEKSLGIKAHNFIQEYYDAFGIFAFIFLFIAMSGLLLTILKIIRSRRTPLDFLILGVMISILIQSLLEPVRAAFPQLIWILIMYHGLSIRYLNFKLLNNEKNL